MTHNEQVTLQETNDRRLADLRDRLRRYLVDPRVGLDPALANNPGAAAQAILDREWERRPLRWFPWLDRRCNGVARLIPAVSQDHDHRCGVSLRKPLEDQERVTMLWSCSEAASDAGAAPSRGKLAAGYGAVC